MRKILFILAILQSINPVFSAKLLIPMDDAQKNHLKAYGVAFRTLDKQLEIHWLLNYRGGSFLLPFSKNIEEECIMKGVSYKLISDATSAHIMNEISDPKANMDALKLQTVPKIAVYSPKGKKPWNDAVTLALTYAEIAYDIVYDDEIMEGKLSAYDWLHLHHEDFTGQHGKFYASYRNMKWYKDEVNDNLERARKYGFSKTADLKKAVSNLIRNFVETGGFLFAMCSATDTFDITLAAEETDICASVFDGDPIDKNAQEKLNYNKTLAFTAFKIEGSPYVYEFSNIDVSKSRTVKKEEDYFSLFEFSAKWDPVPSMLCQNHQSIIKGFMGQTTAFNKDLIKPNVLIMGENKSVNEAKYIHGKLGKGTWTFYGGHDPEDYQHFVGDSPTNLDLSKNSPGYRLILNNILFPAAKKKKHKT